MTKTFIIDGVEYCIVRNPYTNGPMISRVDTLPIGNRKEICRRFLRLHGWTDEMFGNRITNDLERQINKIINGEGNIPSPRLDNTLSRGDMPRVRTVHTSYYPSYEAKKVDISKFVSKFTTIYNSDSHSRYLSYDHIREAFLAYRKDVSNRDTLTLHLYAYLASWGMLRNSFLMQKDYTYLRPVVDVLCKEKYEPIINYNPFIDEGSSNINLIMDIVREIRRCFIGTTYFSEGSSDIKTVNNVSDTLVSKILLGTLGCTVAYDTYVRTGLSSYNLSQKLARRSLYELRSFAKANKEEIESILSSLNHLYNPMKILDMFFFEIGFDIR